MPFSPRLEVPYRVRFDECGADGSLRASTYLRYAQELAWVHSDEAGFDRHWYRERGLTWLVRCAQLEILDTVQSAERLQVSTEVIGYRRVWARRRSEFQGEDDERPRAYAIIDWVLLGPTGRPVRVPKEIEAAFPHDIATFSPASVALAEPPADAFTLDFRVRPQDLDPLQHVNNATYLDYLEETLAAAGGDDDIVKLPRRYRLEYLLAAEPGAQLSAAAWPDELGWSYALRGDDGRELLRARLESDPGAWVGG